MTPSGHILTPKICARILFLLLTITCCERNPRCFGKQTGVCNGWRYLLLLYLHRSFPSPLPLGLLSQDALRAKRNQEVADREWRQKEKENAQKKMETEEKLRKSRLEQVAFKEHTLAVQVQRDRDEFERILR